MRRKILGFAVALIVAGALAAAVLMAQPEAEQAQAFPCAKEAAYLIDVSAAESIVDRLYEDAQDAAYAVAVNREGPRAKIGLMRERLKDRGEFAERVMQPLWSLRDSAVDRMTECAGLNLPQDTP